MNDACQIAAYFKSKGCDKVKTQCLLYYAQGIHLKLYGVPLFEDEEIMACENYDDLEVPPTSEDQRQGEGEGSK